MTPATFQTLKKGDVVQDLETGRAYIIANPYSEDTKLVDVFEIRSVSLDQARNFKRVTWPE